jgi:methionine--tRNA ligase beta chain
MNQYEIQSGANIAIQGFRDINGYLQEQAPWHIADNLELQQIIVRATLEAVYAISHLLLPFLPEGCLKIFTKLGTEPKSLNEINRNCRNLIPGTPITVGDILYERSISASDADASSAAVTSSKKESHAEAQARKKEAKAKQIAASKAKQAADAGGGDDNDDTNQSDFSKMDIRVGKIVKVWYHDGADKLFCEQIDVGDAEGPREIASGLRQHYSLEEMQDRLVLVVCNLKPAKIVGFTSNGMVLAAKATDGSKVELIDVPENAVVGERVYIEGMETAGEPYTSTQVKKKKVWETVSSKLKTRSDDSIATWDGQVIRTSVGPCKAATLTDAPIA